MESARQGNRKFFYEDFENTEFFSQGSEIYRRTGDQEFKIFTLEAIDNPLAREPFICWLREHDHFVIMLLDWAIKRNILVFDRNDNKILYQVHNPKDLKQDGLASWVNIYVDHGEPEMDCFLAKSSNFYCEMIRYHDAQVMREIYPDRNDPRDF